MIKPTVKRGLLLDFIPDNIIQADFVDSNRIFKMNDKTIQTGDIVYLATRELRFEDNWAIQLGIELSEKHNKKFKIVVDTSKIIHSQKQEAFLHEGIEIFKKKAITNGFEFLHKLPDDIGLLIVDFNPINLWTEEACCPVYEVDSHNIVPARYISQKQEYSAATLRRKTYANIANYLTEFRLKSSGIPTKLEDFISYKLEYYAEYKNDINKDITSNLSPYLHLGFISAQRVALEIIKSHVSKENKEAFLEELIVRKELSDNFCLYSKNYKGFDSIPDWAKLTLNVHKKDIRSYVYTSEEFEHAKTHDYVWNEIQLGLINSGRIHGYHRMYWAKKILEWSASPEDALKTAIYLNDEYALDGNDPNGYVGILWSIGGLHDRPFTNRLVTGKIRYISRKKIEKFY